MLMTNTECPAVSDDHDVMCDYMDEFIRIVLYY